MMAFLSTRRAAPSSQRKQRLPFEVTMRETAAMPLLKSAGTIALGVVSMGSARTLMPLFDMRLRRLFDLRAGL